MKKHVTPPGVEAWELLLRAQAALVATLTEEVMTATGLPLSWYDVLLELSRAPGRQLRMSALGERVVLSRSRVSRLVDEMAEAGFIAKTPDPDDGRATLAVLTPSGRAALRRAAPHYLRGIESHFTSRLHPDEIETIRRALGRIVEAG